MELSPFIEVGVASRIGWNRIQEAWTPIRISAGDQVIRIPGRKMNVNSESTGKDPGKRLNGRKRWHLELLVRGTMRPRHTCRTDCVVVHLRIRDEFEGLITCVVTPSRIGLRAIRFRRHLTKEKRGASSGCPGWVVSPDNAPVDSLYAARGCATVRERMSMNSRWRVTYHVDLHIAPTRIGNSLTVSVP